MQCGGGGRGRSGYREVKIYTHLAADGEHLLTRPYEMRYSAVDIDQWGLFASG